MGVDSEIRPLPTYQFPHTLRMCMRGCTHTHTYMHTELSVDANYALPSKPPEMSPLVVSLPWTPKLDPPLLSQNSKNQSRLEETKFKEIKWPKSTWYTCQSHNWISSFLMPLSRPVLFHEIKSSNYLYPIAEHFFNWQIAFIISVLTDW